MNKHLAWLALVACSSSSSSGDPTALDQPLAQNIAITEIAVLQTLEAPIMKDGQPADHATIPVVALRDAVLRVFVNPQSGWQPHAITARARFVTTGPMGTQAEVFSASATIDRATDEGDLSTSFDIAVPGIAIEPGTSVTVVLNDESGDAPDDASSFARWPQDGSAADLGVRSGGDHLRVEIVPVRYDADGSHRLPDTSDAQIESYRQRFYQLYPAAEVDITVHDPWPWSGVIAPDGTGMQQLLTALQQLRAQDQPDPDVYYYAAFEPASSFASYCGGGCVTGLSVQGTPHSVGIGFTDPATGDTATHEVGHAHGLAHAPCPQPPNPGAPSGIDPAYPKYTPSGSIGVWGYDAIGQAMVDPATYKDIMSYCDPKWISDFSYSKIFGRVRIDNKYFNDWVSRPGARATLRRYAVAPVETSGDLRVSAIAVREPWVELGAPREIRWAGGSATGYFFPYDHLPGGVLYVPDEAPSGARVMGLRASEPSAILQR